MKDTKISEAPQTCCKAADSWMDRLVEERKSLLDKTIRLRNFMEDESVKLNVIEWEMLRQQYEAMREYLQVLTDRCTYYGLIESGNLGLDYSKPNHRRY